MEECSQLQLHDVTVDHRNAATTLASIGMSGMSCLEEFVENSISAGATKIELNINWPDSKCPYIECCISDNGIGIDLETFKLKVFSIGESGLRCQDSISIHGTGGLLALYVLQTSNPDWTIETICNESISKNVKYLVSGPITVSKSNAIKEISISNNISCGTKIITKINLNMFYEYSITNTFSFFINRIIERFGLKYSPLLKNRQIGISIKWKHNGEEKQKRGKSSNGDDSSPIRPPEEGTETIFDIDWKKLTYNGDNLPSYREINDMDHKLKHKQYLTLLIDHFDKKRAENLGVENSKIFPLKNHFENVTNPKCFYIYYRGMLLYNARISDICPGKQHTKLFKYSKFVSIIELDPNTDPLITNVVKSGMRIGHPQFDFLKNYLTIQTPSDLSLISGQEDQHEIELKRQIRDQLEDAFKISSTDITVHLETVHSPFGLLDLVITDESKKIQTIIEAKRGRADAKDFIQLKDYGDQIILSNMFEGYTKKYFLLAEDFSKAVKERVDFFDTMIKIELWQMNIDIETNHLTAIRKVYPK